jgi:hypothetical protein
VFDVILQRDAEICPLREISERFGIRLAGPRRAAVRFMIISPNLLFKERMKNDRRGAGIFHELNVVEVLRER